MSKERIMCYSNDIDHVFGYFKSLETFESVFGIRYAYEDGSFDSEVGDCDLNTVLYKGNVYTTPLLLSVTYDDDRDLPLRDSFTGATVRLNKRR